MKSKLRNSENVFLVRINVDVVGRAGERRCLDQSADAGRVVALDIAFELRSESLYLTVISRELPTTAPHVNRVASDKFLFVWILRSDRGIRIAIQTRYQ